MGQYYTPIILADDLDTPVFHFYSHDYDNGLKLMEHSWIGNNFVGAVEQYLAEKPQRLVWAGDYADDEPNSENEEFPEGRNLSQLTEEYGQKIMPVYDSEKDYRYLINLDKKEFVDKTKCPTSHPCNMKVHPLPLLTAEGNGRGGGDFQDLDRDRSKGLVRRVTGESFVGRWARNFIQTTNEVQDSFTEIVPNFSEDDRRY